MARGPKLSPRMKAQSDYVQQKLGESVICQRCGATLETFADACQTDLSEMCEGFQTIEAAREEFYSINPIQLPKSPTAEVQK